MAVVSLLSAVGGVGAVERDLKVTVKTEVAIFTQPGEGAQQGTAVSAQVKPDLALIFDDTWYAVIAPRFRVGLTDSELTLLSLDDLYVEYVAERFEVRAGYQTFFWGTVESQNIVDILNQRDYVGDFLDSEKLGEPSVRIRLLLGEEQVDLYLFSYFTPAPLPGRANRFNFFDGMTDFFHDSLYTSSKERFRQQVAVRWDRTIGSADVGLAYFNGYEKFPVINLAPGKTRADSLYYEMQQVSGDLQMSLGNWLLKSEAVFQETGIAGSFVQPSVLMGGTTRDLVPNDHAAVVVGVEYTFIGVIGKSDLGVVGEYLYDTEQSSGAVAFRPFQNDLFVALRWVRNNPGDGELLVGLFYDLRHRSQLWRVEYSERLIDRFTVKASVDVIDAGSKDPIAIFNNDDRVSIELSYTY